VNSLHFVPGRTKQGTEHRSRIDVVIRDNNSAWLLSSHDGSFRRLHRHKLCGHSGNAHDELTAFPETGAFGFHRSAMQFDERPSER
jgi:hypothetical protein